MSHCISYRRWLLIAKAWAEFRAVRMRFVIDKVALGQIILGLLCFYPANNSSINAPYSFIAASGMCNRSNQLAHYHKVWFEKFQTNLSNYFDNQYCALQTTFQLQGPMVSYRMLSGQLILNWQLVVIRWQKCFKLDIAVPHGIIM